MQGSFNSWDRVPYITKMKQNGDNSTDLVLGPIMTNITRNLIVCNYQCTWPIDHDDGAWRACMRGLTSVVRLLRVLLRVLLLVLFVLLLFVLLLLVLHA
jgi:hypothetical protein